MLGRVGIGCTWRNQLERWPSSDLGRCCLENTLGNKHANGRTSITVCGIRFLKYSPSMTWYLEVPIIIPTPSVLCEYVPKTIGRQLTHFPRKSTRFPKHPPYLYLLLHKLSSPPSTSLCFTTLQSSTKPHALKRQLRGQFAGKQRN